MAEVFLQPYYIFGRKVSVGAFDQGYFGNAAVPTASLDVFGSVRFRGNVVLTDSRLNFGGVTSQTGGNGAVVFGSFNQALGYNSMSQGTNNTVYGNNSIAIGQGLLGSNVGSNQALFGQYNATAGGNVLLVVGDGQDSGNRGDALRVFKSGMVFANALTTGSVTVGSGISSTAYGTLIESNVAGQRQGLATDANATYVYGPSVILAAAGNDYLTFGHGGAEFDSDCVFHGNVTIVGQTFSTVTQKYTTISSVVEASDPIITVGHNYASQGGPYDIGLIGERATSNTGVIWDESRGEWAFIDTHESSEKQQFSQFTYANLHVNSITAGQVTQNGNLTIGGVVAANTLTVSNSTQCQASLTVNGPAIMNTLFVANQTIFNAGIYPTQPDSWPIGANNDRFSRAYVDVLDAYDSLDTYPAKFGGSGEANVYLYTTSPASSDTVGIYFDKGQSQLPNAKSAIVQEYNHWSLRTQGVDRLAADCASGNLRVANELVCCDNVTLYGSQVRLINNVWCPGSIQGNTALWSNTTVYGGTMLPATADAVSIGLPGQRFANVWLDTADLYQNSLNTGPTLKVGSSGNTSLYMYSASNNCQIVLDSGSGNRSTILQSQSSVTLSGASGPVFTANTTTDNLVFYGDQLTMGNSSVVGTLSANSLAIGAVSGNIIPNVANALTIGNARNRFNSAYLNLVDLYGTTVGTSVGANPLRVGSNVATNVYILSDAVAPVSITLDCGGNASPASKSFISQTPTFAAWGVNGQACISLSSANGNVLIATDSNLNGNLQVAGPLTLVNALQGNSAVWGNASVFNGPLVTKSNCSIAIGTTSNRFGQVCVQRLDAYDGANPLRVGSANNTNVYLYSDATTSAASVGVNFDQGNGCVSSLTQNNSNFSLSTSGQARLVANIQTGNISFSNDVAILGSLNLTGALASNGIPLVATQFKAAANAFVSNAADPNLFSSNSAVSYPSSVRVGDYKAPTGVLEVAQANTLVKLGGLNGGASDLTTTSNVMAFNIAGASASAWTFNKVANYGNLATKTAVATIDNTGSYIQSSDARYKQDVCSISDSVTSRLAKLKPRCYTVKGSTRRKYGLIAQEVEEVFPELVHENEAGFLSVDYMALIPIMLSRMLT